MLCSDMCLLYNCHRPFMHTIYLRRVWKRNNKMCQSPHRGTNSFLCLQPPQMLTLSLLLPPPTERLWHSNIQARSQWQPVLCALVRARVPAGMCTYNMIRGPMWDRAPLLKLLDLHQGFEFICGGNIVACKSGQHAWKTINVWNWSRTVKTKYYFTFFFFFNHVGKHWSYKQMVQSSNMWLPVLPHPVWLSLDKMQTFNIVWWLIWIMLPKWKCTPVGCRRSSISVSQRCT